MIRNHFQNPDTPDFTNMMVAHGFDSAIIGVTAPGPNTDSVVVYDYETCVHILMERDGMTWDEAVDYMEYNVVGSFVGPHTPIFMHRGTLDGDVV